MLTAGQSGAGAGSVGVGGQVLVSGTPPVTGSGTTSLPLLSDSCTGATAPTTWNVSGTFFGINTCSSFSGDYISGHLNGASPQFQIDSAGFFRASTGYSGTLATTAVTYQSGKDATATSPGAATFRGGDITSSSSNSIAGSAVTLRGGNNASTGTGESSGAVTINGGDITGGSANTSTTGNITIRGGNNFNTAAGSTIGGVTITGGSQTGAASNQAGADVVIAGGLGTGNSQPAHVKLQDPSFSNTSGTTAQSQVTTYVVHKKSGSTTSGAATSMFQIPVNTNQTIGVEVIVHVETTQATPHNCSTTETFVLAVQNTSSTITQTSTAGTTASICDAGTLTLANTSTLFTTANPAVFKVAPSWTVIAPTAVIITVEVHNLSQQDITLL
jgi:hypothetical protein